ncbi:MAG: LysR family transcriptional regulator [Oscillospiraceae bacterium]|nr:LysR family transcriptional regulator [Oscillospiraceae bacterium]
MTENELLYIKAVTEHKSITRAAASLFISQPSLSQALQRIEAGIGTPLFTRTGSGLLPTYAGKIYYEAALKILKIHSDVVREIGEYSQGNSGLLHIGISPQFGQYVLPFILPHFSPLFPNVDINITEAASHILIEKLFSGTCDFAVLNCSDDDFQPQFEYDLVISKPFVIIANRADPICELATINPAYPFPVLDPSHLQDKRLIMIHAGHRVRKMADTILAQAGVLQPNIPFSVETMQTAFTLVSNGLGVSFSPTQFAVSMAPPNVRFFSIPEKYKTKWSTCVTIVKDGHLSPPAHGFIRIVKDYFQNK